LVVRAFLPNAECASVVDIEKGKQYKMERVHDSGFFELLLRERNVIFSYNIKVTDYCGNTYSTYDPYSFSPVLTDFDFHLFSEGKHHKIYEKLGAHICTINAVKGTVFTVWAPCAKRVSVVGNFNQWDGRRHQMRNRGPSGIWEIFIPGIEEGELFSLLGLNGAGKTTTIKMLSCLCRPTSGDAILLGDSIVKSPLAVKEKISVSPQETAVAPNLTVKENLQLIAKLYGNNNKEAIKKTDEMIEKFGLTEIAKSKAKTLSGGWQRRLSIAMALISSPQILFLDEPTLGLDVIARRELWNIVKELKGKITIILTTHYLEEAEALSDRIGIMAKGELKAVGTVNDLLKITGAQKFEDAFVTLSTDGRVSI